MTERLFLTVVFEEADPVGLRAAADRLSVAGSEAPYLSRGALKDLLEAPAAVIAELCDWLGGFGITPAVAHQSPNVQVMHFRCTADSLGRAFGARALRWLGDAAADRPARSEWPLPASLRGWVQAIQVQRPRPGWGATAAPPPASTPGAPPPMGFTPAQIARHYDFPSRWTGAGETIALLLLDAEPPRADCQAFWRAHGIQRSPARVRHVGPPPSAAPDTAERLEAAMQVQWAGAMAPDAELVCYVMRRDTIADKWASFLMAMVCDHQNDPTVASTSWLIAERDYYAAFGAHVITGALDQVAALGITVLAASGDWGAFDGEPRTRHRGVTVADQAWPHAVFPAVEERIIGVGGTMLTSLDPPTEIAWSGPLPAELAGRSPFSTFAGGGGFSEEVPIPEFQRFLVLDEDGRMRRRFSRGPHVPAVVASGRGVPDVGLAAVGPAVQRIPGGPLRPVGYQAVVGGRWIDHAGGTSLAAPIWAAIIARVNEARRAAGRPRVGCCGPLLYEAARRTADSETPAFRDVRAGRTDVVLRTVNHLDDVTDTELPGFDARRGWDPVTGLGVPDVSALEEAVLAVRAPVGDAEGGD